ncbi:DegT/DnrJ/EryC1/StrS family aminotransferase [Prauserella flavalba]|uniref:DegT/DnrJ/EryC1/StrS family aminotransferase n=1 Tax=Prauserella flavalba TaxID=1477506 RepID=UPI000D768349|nr:DegT/DnrJ/EryC1/StrS family aminotransferase [Prauserella flavalba]
MIPLVVPELAGNEARYLQECVTSGYVSSAGPFVGRFEREFAAQLGAEHAVACASGTAALHVALRLLGAGPGKLVAVSDFTFIASANAISYTGADMLLVDSEPRTWNMDTELLHDEVVRRARNGGRLPDVIEIVHVLGHPADVEPLLELRNRFGIPIVEDAAESLGASWKPGPQVGTVGDIGCFSFNGNKLVTTGGGGMIVTGERALAERARHLINQAKLSDDQYLHDTIGYNYRLANVGAALGVAQIERIGDIMRAKRLIAQRYERWLAGLAVTPAPCAEWARPSYWLYSILLSAAVDLDSIVDAASVAGVQARRVWPPLHRQKPYVHTERLGGHVADDLYRRGLSLPSSAGLPESDQRVVCDRLHRILPTAP